MAARLHAGARQARVLGLVGALALSLAACVTAPQPYGRLATNASESESRTNLSSRLRAYNRPYQVRGRWYTPREQPGYDQVGLASWYSYESPSHTTADGEVFDIRTPSAAHTTLPIPSWLEVTNLNNGRVVRVRLNDRGPFAPGRILDVSRAAAEQLGFVGRGVARVRVRYLGPAQPAGPRQMVWADAAAPRRRTAPLAEGGPLLEPVAGGPAPDRVLSAQAEVVEDAVLDAGDVGEDHPASTLAAPPSPEAQGFRVQAGAFADRENAERAVMRLAQTGEASVRPLTRSDGAVLYRVVVGDWSQASQAASARSRIASLGFADARVVAP